MRCSLIDFSVVRLSISVPSRHEHTCQHVIRMYAMHTGREPTAVTNFGNI